MTNLYGFNAVTRSNGYGQKPQSIDDIYNSLVLGNVENKEIKKSENIATKFLEDVFAPVITETAEKTSRISWASKFPTFAKIVGFGGKFLDAATGIVDLGKTVYEEAMNPSRSGEKIVVSVGKTVAKSLTTSAIAGVTIALTSSVFPLLIPSALVIAAGAAGIWYLPDIVARGVEKTIRGLGYAAGYSGSQGREAYEWLQEKDRQIGGKISQAEAAVTEFKELLAERKGR